MARRRFRNVGSGSFFGQFLYERVVPRDHFLVKLNQLIDCDPFVELLVPAYKELAEMGRPPYLSVVLLKMLIVAYLYGFSERQVEDATNYRIQTHLPALVLNLQCIVTLLTGVRFRQGSHRAVVVQAA